MSESDLCKNHYPVVAWRLSTHTFDKVVIQLRPERSQVPALGHARRLGVVPAQGRVGLDRVARAGAAAVVVTGSGAQRYAKPRHAQVKHDANQSQTVFVARPLADAGLCPRAGVVVPLCVWQQFSAVFARAVVVGLAAVPVGVAGVTAVRVGERALHVKVGAAEPDGHAGKL